MISNHNTLGARALKLPHSFAMVFAGALLLAIAAQIKVPMWPVPMTLQTVVVLMIGLTYGGRLASLTLAFYLLQGALGLPVFSGGGGIMHLFGPTGGYLVGFLLAASFLGYAADRNGVRTLPVLVAMLAGATLLIYLPGVLWLSGFVGLKQAVVAGMLPFLLGDALKAALVALLHKPARRVLRL